MSTASSSSSSSSAVFRRFFLPPSALRLISLPLRILESKSPKNKLSILCFRHEHNSTEPPDPEGISHCLPEELMQYEFSHSRIPKRDRDSTPKKSANTLMTILGEQWVVPWAAGTILQVVIYWATAFWLIGSWTVRCAAHRYGCNVKSFTYEGKALHRLVTEVTQALAGITILWLCLSQYCPLPPGWFRFSLKGKWPLDVILGCLTFPAIPRLARFNRNLIRPPPPSPSRRVIRPIVEQSLRAKGLHVIEVSICAPLWEEIFFRGFLMASLTRYMPVWSAILVSSIVFAIAHLNSRMILPHVFFGIVMGATFSRSRNLFSPMLLHGLYNVSVSLGLFK